MKFYNKDSSDYNYFKIFIAVFAAIVSSICVYFLFSKISYVGLFLKKLISVLMPVIIGCIFACLLDPIVKRIEKRLNKKDKLKGKKKLSRILSILITYLIFIFFGVIFIKFLIPSLLESINMMLQNIPKYLENIFKFLRKLCEKYNINPKFLDEYSSGINGLIKVNVMPNIDVIINNLASGITSVVKGIINILVSIIISIYLIYDKESFISGTNKFMQAYCPKKIYEDIKNVVRYIYKVFGSFMAAKIVDSLIIGILTFIVLSIFRIPYALIISFFVGVTNIIPYFGPFIGAIPSLMLLLMVNPTKALEFGIIILVIQQFDGNILGPKLIGKNIGIKSFWVLFSILLFGGLFGFVGMIIAVPLFACIYEFLKGNVDSRLKNKKEKEKIDRT